MNSNKLYGWLTGIVLILALFAFVGCGNWGWEEVSGETDSVLNIFGLISADPATPSFVVVHKTLGLSGADRDPNTYESKYVVRDATVLISDGQQTWNFRPVPHQPIVDPWGNGDYYYNDDELTYIDTTGRFHPLPDHDYTLLISTPGGLSLTGTTHTPPQPHIKWEFLPDTIALHRNFSVQWTALPDVWVELTTGANDYLCGTNIQETIPPGDSIWTSSYPMECYSYEWGPDLVLLEIAIKALDENFYGYFYQHQADEFYSFFMGLGSEAASYGVSGGLGIFGSVSRSHIYRPAIP